MRATGTVAAVERRRVTARTGTTGTHRLPLAGRERQLEPTGEGSPRDHNKDRSTGVLAGRVSEFFRGYLCRSFTEAGEGGNSCAEARHRSADP